MEVSVLKDFGKAKNPQELYNCKTRYLGKKGSLTELSKQIPQLPVEQRPLYGKKLNQLKGKIEVAYETLQKGLLRKALEEKMEQERLDLTLPSPQRLRSFGGSHPVSKVMESLFYIMSHLGYSLRLGPIVEECYNNFDALNIPKDHPAREMQDTFFLKGDRVLRTHTSPVQVHSLRKEKPPLRILSMGAVFRRDNDISHLPHFHQMEGMCIDEKVSMANLKGTMQFLLQEFFSQKIQIRFRPSFFPFTEPSAEVDCSCPLCLGKGCSMCSHSGWLEIAGCGLVHPNVLSMANLSTERWQGFAFGFGIERMAIIKYGIKDIRLFPENNLHFLEQFIL